MKISPLPWWPVEPVLARPSPARRASLVHAAESSGASVTMTTMQDPAGAGAGAGGGAVGDGADGAGRAGGAAGSARPTATPLTVSRSWLPKFVSTSTPTVCPDGVTRDEVPIPPLKPRQLMPVPAPTAPSPG